MFSSIYSPVQNLHLNPFSPVQKRLITFPMLIFILGAPSFPCSYLLEQPAIIPIEGLRGRQRHPPMVPKPTTHVGRESLGPQAGSGWKERK